jgi:hypothetical protein
MNALVQYEVVLLITFITVHHIHWIGLICSGDNSSILDVG